MANVTRTRMKASVKTAYDRRLLMRALPRLLHGRWGRPATFDGYKNWEIRRMEGFTDTGISPLTEGVDPIEHAAPAISTYTLEPQWYGTYVQYTEEVSMQTIDPVILETSRILGEHAGKMIDILIRDEITANATADYAGGAEADTDIDTTNDKISYADLVQDVALLQANGALPAENGYYPVIIHPYSWATLMQDTTFVALFTREGGEAIRSGLIGRVLNCELYTTYNAKVSEGAGATTDVDVYHALFIGEESYGLAGMTGLAPNWNPDGGPPVVWGQGTGKSVNVARIIVKDLGETGFDPLDRRGTIGWKATHDQIVLNSSWIVSLHHANDFS